MTVPPSAPFERFMIKAGIVACLIILALILATIICYYPPGQKSGFVVVEEP